jgi:hypothetical protein
MDVQSFGLCSVFIYIQILIMADIFRHFSDLLVDP